MNKFLAGFLTAVIIVVIWNIAGRIFLYEYTALYDKGKQSQIEDNIKKGVMNENGKWKDGFQLAR